MSEKESLTDDQPGSPVLTQTATPYFTPDLVTKRYQRIFLYFVYGVVGYKLVVQYMYRACCRVGDIGFWMSPIDNTINLIGGIYQWHWRHLPEDARPSDIKMFVMYCVIFILLAMVMGLLFSQDEDDDYFDNVITTLFGFLLAQIAINLALAGGGFPFGFLGEWFAVVANHYLLYLFAACYFMLRLNRLPLTDGTLNRVGLFAGFFTGLLFIVASGSFSSVYFLQIMHPSISVSSADLLNIRTMFIYNVALALVSLLLAWVLVKVLGFKKWLDKFEKNKPAPESTIGIDEDLIKKRLAQRK